MTPRGVIEDEEATARREYEALLAASPMIQVPSVTDPQSLRAAIRYADSHPEARGFAVKGAVRLDLIDLLPQWPEVGQTIVHVNGLAARITAAGALVAAATGQPLGNTSQQPPLAPQRASDAPEVARLLPRIADLPSLRRAVTVADQHPEFRAFVAKACAQADRLRWLPEWPELDRVVISIDGADYRIRGSRLEPVRRLRPVRDPEDFGLSGGTRNGFQKPGPRPRNGGRTA
ncbi:MAG: hypothetical protein JWN15_2435 [Firmicutes bacterium]|nr:hypothetical protein [Bacillota bacterium]